MLSCRVTRARRLSSTACLVALLCVAGPGLAVADTVRIAIDPPAQTLSAGATATVTVQVSGGAPVYGVELLLRFDPALLEVVDADAVKDGVQVEPGTLFSGKQTFTAQNAADNTAGTIDYAVTLAGEPQGVAQGGPIAVIRFRGRAAGQASIAIGQALVADAGGLAIAVSTQDGSIVVAGGAPPTATSPAPTATLAQAAPTAVATAGASPVPATGSPTAAATVPPTAAATPVRATAAQPATPTATVLASALSTTATAQPAPTGTRTSSPPRAEPPARSGSVPAAVIPAALVIAIGALAGLYLWRRGWRPGPPSAGA